MNDTASLPVDATVTSSAPHGFHHRNQSTAAPNCVADALITSVLHQRPRKPGRRSGSTTSAVARLEALRTGVRDEAARRCGRRARRPHRPHLLAASSRTPRRKAPGRATADVVGPERQPGSRGR